MARDSFSFPNFGNGYDDAVVGADELQRMYGDGVCASSARPCVLTPAAKAFARTVNKSMQGGHCEGFVVLASMLRAGVVAPTDFGATTTRDLELKNNAPLQRELAYWFSTQYHPSVTRATKGYTAKDLVPRLYEILKKDSSEEYRLGIVKKQGGKVSGGHALTPIAISLTSTEGVYELRVYDNNLPDQEHTMRLDTRANTWTYEAAAATAQRRNTYVGDTQNKNLVYLAPILTRRGQLPCHFCDGKVQVASTGGVQPSVQTAGGTTGVVDGELMTAQGAVTPGFSAVNDDDGASYIINLDDAPQGDLAIALRPGADEADGPPLLADVTAQGSSYANRISGLSSTQTDAWSVSADGAIQTFANASRSPVTVSSSLERGGKLVEVSATVSGSSEQVSTSVAADGTVEVSTSGSAGASISVTVTVASPGGTTASTTVTYDAAGDTTAKLDSTALARTGTTTAQIDNNGTTTVVGDSCADGVKSGSETDVDCGGRCITGCAVGRQCTSGPDCVSGACSAISRTCVVDACQDGARDGSESDLDCGGLSPTCSRCAAGQTCASTLDCATTLVCDRGSCRASYRLAAQVSGLPAFASFALSNVTNGETLEISANGTMAFGTRVTGSYQVAVTRQPDTARCVVASGSGSATADVTVSVTCTPTFQIAGTLVGLPQAASVTLLNNGVDQVVMSADGLFSFTERVIGPYAVTVAAQPAGRFCAVLNGTGTATADVFNVSVNCLPTSNCKEVLAASPSAPSGIYTIAPMVDGGRVSMPAYCEMAIADGGWTQVLDQDFNAPDAGAQPTLTEWAGPLNEGTPNNGRYSVLDRLPLLKSGTGYEFLLVYPAPPAAGTIQWTQLEDPRTFNGPGRPTVSGLATSPAGMLDDGNNPFSGLSRVPNGQAYLSGDARTLYMDRYWFSVGIASPGLAIPSYFEPRVAPYNGGSATSAVRLFVR